MPLFLQAAEYIGKVSYKKKAMNLKKIIILPIGFVLVHVLYIGCCKCVEGNFFREVSSIRALHYSKLPNTSVDTVYVADTLFTTVQLNYNYISKANPFGSLVNAAYATSCHCPGFNDSGYKYRVDSIVITSRTIFNGAVPGTNLASSFKAMLQCNTGTVTAPVYVPVQQMLDSSFKCRRYDNIELICPVPVVSDKVHAFKYILYSNGKTYEASGHKIVKWQ